MEYFNLLELNKEPFSNSPEPEFLFSAPQHNTCLQRLELAVRLRRGLNIVIGAVGTGKTTLCRKLIQNLSVPVAGSTPEIETFLLLDPAVDSRLSFLKIVASILGVGEIAEEEQEWQIKEKIKNFLFEQGVQNLKNTVLVIDEGQKIPDDCLEVLREFLNYETNSFKLLQIIIFAQPELKKSLAMRENLLDRVNYLFYLTPLTFPQTKAMIKHRIAVASRNPDRKSFFTFGAMLAIYAATSGYPRKVVSLCHQVLIMMIIRGKSRAGWWLVRCTLRQTPALRGFRRIAWTVLVGLIGFIVALSAIAYLKPASQFSGLDKFRHASAGIDLEKDSLSSAGDSEERITERGVIHENSGSKAEDHFQQAGNAQGIMPKYLGNVALKKRMTIWRVLENIYGDTSRESTRRLMRENSHIANINNISEGDIIRVPVWADKARSLRPDAVIVSVGKSSKLENLYHVFIQKKDVQQMPALLFLSMWNRREGKQFAIILDRRFTSAEEAQEYIRHLPPELAVSARVMSQWDQDTVIFNGRYRL